MPSTALRGRRNSSRPKARITSWSFTNANRSEHNVPHDVISPLHEPACSAGFPACGFTGLSSPVDQERATGKSPGPAGSKACATTPPGSRAPGREKKGVGPTNDPPPPPPSPPPAGGGGVERRGGGDR